MNERYGVLWDLDHTLLPSKEIASSILETVLPEFSCLPPEPEEIHKVFGMSLSQMLHTLTDGHPDHENIIDRFIEEQEAYYTEKIQLFEGCLDTVATIGELGVKQAIVTTRKDKDRGLGAASSIVKMSGIGQFVDIVVCGDDTDKLKPDPAPVNLALSRLGIKPKNAIMVGDQAGDMLSAKAAHVTPIGLVHDNFPLALKYSNNLLLAGARAVRFRPEAILAYTKVHFGIE